MVFLSLTITAGLLVNFLGWILVGALLVVLSFLTVIVVLAYLFYQL
jgi:hypothetical protein